MPKLVGGRISINLFVKSENDLSFERHSRLLVRVREKGSIHVNLRQQQKLFIKPVFSVQPFNFNGCNV